MTVIQDIYEAIDKQAPFSTQLSFDNAGLLVGCGRGEVTRILVALDVTPGVIDEAIALDAQLIVSHHPVIWDAPKSITDDTVLGKKLLALITNHIGVISAHTNLDAACGGVNDVLAATLGLVETSLLHTDGVDANGTPYGIERVGRLASGSSTLKSFATHVKSALSAACVRVVDSGRPVERVAVGGGNCSGSLAQVVAAGCDTFVTADVKYDGFLDAKALGINLIDAGHYPTENLVCPVLVRWLREAFPSISVTISTTHREVYTAL